ncbi:ATP-dependent helicase [Candidatus Saccharibacteria bacterium]|nr:ATP-dependent helicase [Candidatus Saccharibacteria bacterium]
MPLNPRQKEAVEYLEGPLLVLAGPGTGKTQLLSEKVAYILKNTDTDASNILCLTFTESGAFNMRERLKTIIGNDALKINIGTYHAFGQDILAKYKNYSTEYLPLFDTPIDEVVQFKIIKQIRDDLPANDILNGDKIKDIISVISEAKSAGLTATQLKKIAEQNIEDSLVLSQAISPLLANIVPRQFKPSLENAYRPIYEILNPYENLPTITSGVERSIAYMARDLKSAIALAESTQKIKPLSNWKDNYFEKDEDGGYRLSDRVANKKLLSLAMVMDKYQNYLKEHELCDFDDMIIEAGKVLKNDRGFLLTLQERYQYILLDEFQDTNPSQLNIIKTLTDYEKPIIMAVGDDDQAIYEFQGANATNLSEFQAHYNAHVITLTENYRSTQEILDFAKQVIDQAPDRFVNEKFLTAHLENPTKTGIHRFEFLSSDQEYSFIADKITELIASGVSQNEIAIISNKHKYFTPLLPYLKAHSEIKIAYERRDNLLDDERLHQIITILRMADALSREEKPSSSILEILSYDFFNVRPIEVIRLTAEAREAHKTLFDFCLTNEISDNIYSVIDFLSDLGAKVATQPLESILIDVTTRMKIDILTPYEVFKFYENLAALKAKLIRYCGEKPLRVHDLIEMVDDYEKAEIPLTATSPYRDADEAVSVLSAHKAKGLEFSYVFILSADHTCWGKGKGNNNFLTLPKNLIHIRHTGITDGEKIRVLYVALTRAKHTLYITNSLHDFAGKSPERLEYFDELKNAPDVQPLTAYEPGDKAAQSLKNYLTSFIAPNPDMHLLYLERIKKYRMSASSLTSFIDIVNAGPEEFFKKQILHVEAEPEDETLAMGNLVHATFEQVTNSGISDEAAVGFYLSELEKRDLSLKIKNRIREKGPDELLIALKKFSHILRNGKAEVNLAYEKLMVDEIPVTGKIDHLLIDEKNKTIEIYDFKTGKYHKEKWQSQPTLYKYMLQLEFYKLLLNSSPTYAKYKIEKAHILFVKPNHDGEVFDKVYLYNAEGRENLLQIMKAIYFQIEDLKFLSDPEIMITANKNFGLKEIKAFIELLLAKNSV